ncbi:DUF1877 family protein [Nocardia bovistercoris]|uniref:YfbM family protein n=1 Tax=Nocardia bovistercoris TaxID=2785916 RepID=A0A931IJR6_9NOCA|nr:DUF1877 family protein [Nocardia bovistercoris]MBH0781277.1 YfbM family protein [Nocardia bovistercoris]
MGMVMGFTAITAEEMAVAVVDRETAWELARERHGFGQVYLDKAWDGLRYLMRAGGVGVDLLEDGTLLDDGDWLSVWSVDEVAEAAVALETVPFADLRGWYDPARMNAADVYPEIWESDWALDYLLNYYRDLRSFFLGTAAKQRAALMTLG